MTIVATEDKRNQEWRNANVGLKLLEKMGYKDGQGIGKRNTNNTALRALKRKEGLGLGAKIESEGGNSESSNHFSAVLANLQAHHQPATPTKKSKKKKTKKLTLPQNKVTAGHAAKRREAKFGAKSAEDMACIFGNSSIVLDLKPIGETKEEEKKKKKKRSRDSSDDDEEKRDEDKLEKKKRKKDKEEAKLLYFSEDHEQVIHDQLSMISTSLRYVNSDQYRKSQVQVRKNALMQCGKYFESMREFDVDNYEHHFSERRSSVFV